MDAHNPHNIVFQDDRLISTDYFESQDCRCGQAWAITARGTWHILSPQFRPSKMPAFARPVQCHEDDVPEGWAWQFELDGSHVLLPTRVWRPYCPMPPLPNKRHNAQAIIYTGYTDPRNGKGHFAGVPVGFRHFSVQLVVGR